MTTFLGGSIRSLFVDVLQPLRFFFVFKLEFAEAGYHNILSGFEGLFDDFQKGLDDFGRLIPVFRIGKAGNRLEIKREAPGWNCSPSRGVLRKKTEISR